MRRSEKAFFNSSVSFLSQILSLIFTLVTRKIFLNELGVELLGISNTFVSVLNTLSLAELGFETAIIFNLYEPLNKNDHNKISNIIEIYKRIYFGVAAFVLIASLICMPFLKFILNGIVINHSIYIYFMLQAINSVVSYMLAYKRTLVYANQKEYLCQMVDLVCNIGFSILRISVLVLWKSFILYLIMQILQTLISNIWIHVKCKKMYPFLKDGKFDISLFKNVLSDVKQVFASKVAYFINNSTDNIVISTMAGTILVGYFTNYTTITSNIKKIILSIMRPVSPIIGDMLADENVDNEKKENVMLLYTHVGYIFALVIIIPTMVLLDDFIGFVYGSEYILNKWIVILISFDLYINLVHRVCCDYINGAGLFKYDKYIEFLGAITNIVISVALVKKYSILGVLIGTALSAFLFWLGRSIVVYRYCIGFTRKKYFKYWLKNLYSLIIFYLLYLLCMYVYNTFFHYKHFLTRFLIGGVGIEIIIFAVYLIVFLCFSEQRELIRRLKEMFLKIKLKRKM